MGINLASKYASKVDERFTKQAQSTLITGNDYEFTGVETVKVYSIPVVPMQNYSRSGSGRYGTPNELTRNVQTMTVTQDKSFTFTLDRGDKTQSMMVTDAGKALARQTAEVVIPMYDKYIFEKVALAAIAHGHADTTAATKANAYELFLHAMEVLGNKNVPDSGRVCLCTYGFANLLKQDPAFMKYGNLSQEMILKGVIGEVDGCKIVKVPTSRLPEGTSFIMAHPMAVVAPKQLQTYKTHDNPPGIDGWLVEGRFLFDCFVLDEKADALFYQGGSAKLKTLVVGTAASAAGKTTVTVNPDVDAGNSLKYVTGASATAVTYGGASTSFSALTNGQQITPTSSHKVITVVECNASGNIVGVGTAKLNIG